MENSEILSHKQISVYSYNNGVLENIGNSTTRREHGWVTETEFLKVCDKSTTRSLTGT